jgi:hypothetical protein
VGTGDSAAGGRALYESRGLSPGETKPGEMGGVPVTEEMWRLKLD